jgi:hypothetical protein
VIQLTVEAAIARGRPGRHTLFFANHNSDELTVYVVAALAPSLSEIAIVKQDRDWFQRQIRIQYDVAGGGLFSSQLWLEIVLAGAAAALMLAVVALLRGRKIPGLNPASD